MTWNRRACSLTAAPSSRFRRALQEIKATGAITAATKDALPFEALRNLDDGAAVREQARRFHVIQG